MRAVHLALLLAWGACNSQSTGSSFTGEADAAPVPTVLATTAQVSGLAADGTNVYFASAFAPSMWALSAVPVGGGAVQELANGDDFGDGCTPSVQEAGASIALGGSIVYFASLVDIGSVSGSGGAPTFLASNPCGDLATGLAVQGGILYWMQSPATSTMDDAVLKQLSPGGSPPIAIASGLVPSNVRGVADATNYYWAGIDGSINRIPLTGGPVAVLASSPGWDSILGGLTVDTTYVYFSLSSDCAAPISDPTECPSPSPSSSPIMRVPIAGGPVTTIVTDDNIAGIAVDARNVYWVDPDGGVKWAPLEPGADAGGAHVLAADASPYLGPVVANGAVYWVSGVETSQIRGAATPR